MVKSMGCLLVLYMHYTPLREITGGWNFSKDFKFNQFHLLEKVAAHKVSSSLYSLRYCHPFPRSKDGFDADDGLDE